MMGVRVARSGCQGARMSIVRSAPDDLDSGKRRGERSGDSPSPRHPVTHHPSPSPPLAHVAHSPDACGTERTVRPPVVIRQGDGFRMVK